MVRYSHFKILRILIPFYISNSEDDHLVKRRKYETESTPFKFKSFINGRIRKSIGILFTAYEVTGKRKKQIKKKQRNHPIPFYYSFSSYSSNHQHSDVAGAKNYYVFQKNEAFEFEH